MLPQFLKTPLKSYDLNKLDKVNDKEKIIFYLLNYGNFQSIKWLFKNYHLQDILKVLKSKNKIWLRSSYKFWSKIFRIKEQKVNYGILPSFRKRNKKNFASL